MKIFGGTVDVLAFSRGRAEAVFSLWADFGDNSFKRRELDEKGISDPEVLGLEPKITSARSIRNFVLFFGAWSETTAYLIIGASRQKTLAEAQIRQKGYLRSGRVWAGTSNHSDTPALKIIPRFSERGRKQLHISSMVNAGRKPLQMCKLDKKGISDPEGFGLKVRIAHKIGHGPSGRS